MEFGIKKCAMTVMKRDNLDMSGGIRLPVGRLIRSIGDDVQGNKYLGKMEADDIMHDEVKRSMKKEYIRRVRKTLFSKLNAGMLSRLLAAGLYPFFGTVGGL